MTLTTSGRHPTPSPRTSVREAAHRVARSLIVSALAILGITSQAAPATAADSAVILIYHRFGEDTLPSTNIRLEQFEAHIA